MFGNTQGSVATYLCDTGYELESGASSNRVCGGDGQWSGVTPVCEGTGADPGVGNTGHIPPPPPPPQSVYSY